MYMHTEASEECSRRTRLAFSLHIKIILKQNKFYCDKAEGEKQIDRVWGIVLCKKQKSQAQHRWHTSIAADSHTFKGNCIKF